MDAPAIGRATPLTVIVPLEYQPRHRQQPQPVVFVTGSHGTKWHDGPPVEPQSVAVLEETLARFKTGDWEPAGMARETPAPTTAHDADHAAVLHHAGLTCTGEVSTT